MTLLARLLSYFAIACVLCFVFLLVQFSLFLMCLWRLVNLMTTCLRAALCFLVLIMFLLQRGWLADRVRRSRPPKLRIGARGGLLTTSTRPVNARGSHWHRCATTRFVTRIAARCASSTRFAAQRERHIHPYWFTTFVARWARSASLGRLRTYTKHALHRHQHSAIPCYTIR